MLFCNLAFQPGEKNKTLLPVMPGTDIPVWVVSGKESGPTLVVTAGVHGCEFVGIQAVRRFYEHIDPATFRGRLIMLPLVNQSGFYHGKKQIVPEDGKNLNRVFPGDRFGTVSQQMAYVIEQEIYPLADFLVDLHGGDINEALTPLIFFPAAVEEHVSTRTREAAMHLPVTYRVRSTSGNGLYSYAAKRGIPSFLLEIGGGGRWREEEVALCQVCLTRLMGYLKMRDTAQPNPGQLEGVEAVYEEAEADGFWQPCIAPNQNVQRGMLLGQLWDLDGRLIREYTAGLNGVVWYHTTTLGVQKGDPLVAYGRCE
ncbi:M14 family metallopeptidase [Lacrimispora indolis]|uniref:M14 family metallopeptidase n=1 Tax=Lacrimispora indolis TaxID=69825 RepID=UPI000411CCC0|nr:M14 family metallopeptidase [[Clostridium] methoxybenzovorans]